MRSMWLVAPGQFEQREIPRPVPGPDEVLVQIAYVGICPWDVRVYAGKKSVPLPRVMGHEASGRIVDTGSEVKHLRPGQRVMADFIVKCGACDPCRTGRSNRCQHPRFPNGAYEEYAVLPQRNIFLMREEKTSYRAAAFTEPNTCMRASYRAYDAVAMNSCAGLFGFTASSRTLPSVSPLLAAVQLPPRHHRLQVRVAGAAGDSHLLRRPVRLAAGNRDQGGQEHRQQEQ